MIVIEESPSVFFLPGNSLKWPLEYGFGNSRREAETASGQSKNHALRPTLQAKLATLRKLIKSF